MKINNVIARELLDSRGNPALEVDVILENGIVGRSMVPSGASVGNKEALELRDKDQSRFFGKGLLKAVNNVNTIIRKNIIGMDVSNQKAIDSLLLRLDGTKNKSNLGANAILGVSMSCLKANCIEKKIPLYSFWGNKIKLPIPLINIINGGKHAFNKLDFQEFMIMPKAKTFHKIMEMATTIFHNLKKILEANNFSTGVGDEGGFAPNLKNNVDAIKLIVMAITKSGYKPGEDVYIAIDMAANSFYKDGKYYLENKILTTDEVISYYKTLIDNYPIISIEDPLYEDDILGYQKLTKLLGSKIQIVGDDLFVTNKEYLASGIKNHIANAILIKLNQIGTVSEAIETIELAKKYNYAPIISHRSGEVEDSIIASLAVGLNIGQIKCGSVCRGERIMKYNELLRMEDSLLNR